MLTSTVRPVPKANAWRPTLSVRQYFTLIAVLAVLPWIALAIYVGDRVANDARDALRTALMSSARSLAAAVDGALDKHIAVATTLTHSRPLLRGDWDGFREQAKDSLSFLPGSALLVADAAGRQILNTDRPAGEPLPPRPDEIAELHQRAFATGEPQVSDIFIGRNSGRPVASINVPTFRDGKPLYTLAIRVDPQQFRKLLDQQHLPSDWYAAIVDRKGTIVVRLADPEGHSTGHPTSESWLHAMREAAEGFIENRSVNGEALVNAYTRGAHGWSVGIGIAKSALDAPLWHTRLILAIVGLVCIGLSIVLAWLLASKFDSATRALKAAAGTMAHELPVAAPEGTGIREYDEIGSAFASASSLLQARSAERRTAEQALARRVDEVAAVHEFTERRFRATSVAEICDAALDAILKGLHCNRAAILQFDAAGVMRFVAWRGLSERYRAAVEGHSPWKPDEQDPQPVVIADVDRAEELTDWLKSVVRAERIHALGFLPVIADSRLIGKIMTYYEAPHAFSEAELKVAMSFARRLGFAIAHKRAEDAREIAGRELQHRCNNLLAVVQAIAQKTLSGASSLADASAAFEARLQALARAHRQLVKSNWTGVSLDEIVRLAMEPFGGRSEIEGENIVLAPKDAQNFSLAVHELATNAVKYGALSCAGGKISIAWAITNAQGDRVLKFQWQERGGPEVAVPRRHGFGTALIKATFRQVQFDYAPAGLMCEIDVRLENLAAADFPPL